MKGKVRPCAACPYWKDGDCTLKGIRRMADAVSCDLGRKAMWRDYMRDWMRRRAAQKRIGEA